MLFDISAPKEGSFMPIFAFFSNNIQFQPINPPSAGIAVFPARRAADALAYKKPTAYLSLFR